MSAINPITTYLISEPASVPAVASLDAAVGRAG